MSWMQGFNTLLFYFLIVCRQLGKIIAGSATTLKDVHNYVECS